VFSRRLLLFATLSANLCACGLLAPRPDLGPVGPGEFAVSGRLGVNRGEDGFSSSFSWHQAGDDFEIELWGPLGQGRTRLEGRNGRVTIHAADGEVTVESDTAATMERWLGFSVPVAALVHWIRGEPAPGIPVTEQRIEAGERVALDQLDWQLEFARWNDVAGHHVPGRIIARRGPVKVTLLPKDWSFSPASL